MTVEVVEVSCKRVPIGMRCLSSVRGGTEDKAVDPDILTDAPSLHWYALLTPPGREFVAQKILRRYGLRTFIPVKRDWRRKNKFVKAKELFVYAAVPRYVFTGFKAGPLWFDLFNLPVISGVVGLEGRPMGIRPASMVKLIGRTEAGINAPAAQRFMRTHHEFSIGQFVEVIDGPFEGKQVPVVELRGHRASVMMEMFGAETRIELPTDILQAA